MKELTVFRNEADEIPIEVDPLFHEHWLLLIAKSQDLGISQDALRTKTRANVSSDDADSGADNAAKELNAIVLTNESNIRTLVVEAIHRLKTDRYGNCLACPNQIGIKRLKAIPWARFCTDCQTLAESGEMPDARQAVPVKSIRNRIDTTRTVRRLRDRIPKGTAKII